MNDKTLLELAARASGYGLCIDNAGNRFTNFPDKTGWQTMVPWNPLTDDGDALRLAVKLMIDFYIGDDSGEAAYAGYYKSDAGGLRQRFIIQRFAVGPSPYAATRRAIVRAAAAIAEQGEKE